MVSRAAPTMKDEREDLAGQGTPACGPDAAEVARLKPLSPPAAGAGRSEKPKPPTTASATPACSGKPHHPTRETTNDRRRAEVH